MVQINTSNALAAASAPEEDPGEVEFFTFEGPKISFGASIGTSNEMSLYGFKAVTAISHKNSISWGPAAVEGSGPVKLGIEIKGARKSVKMELASGVEVNPGAVYYKIKEKMAARAVQAAQDAKKDKEDAVVTSATVVESENNGDQNDNRVEVTGNVSSVE